MVESRDVASLKSLNEFLQPTTKASVPDFITAHVDHFITGRAMRILWKEALRDMQRLEELMRDAAEAGLLETAVRYVAKMDAVDVLSSVGCYNTVHMVRLMERESPGRFLACGGIATFSAAMDKLLSARPIYLEHTNDHVCALQKFLQALAQGGRLYAKEGPDQVQSFAVSTVLRSCLFASFLTETLSPRTDEYQKNLSDCGRLMRYMLVFYQSSASEVLERLSHVVDLMIAHPESASLQRWVIYYGLLPVARRQLSLRRRKAGKQYCRRACCAARGLGVPELLTMLLQKRDNTSAMRQLAAAFEAHAETRVFGARLLVYVAQANPASLELLKQAPSSKLMMSVLEAARKSAAAAAVRLTAAERVAADAAAFESDDDENTDGAPNCTRPASDRRDERLAIIEAALAVLSGGPAAEAEREAAAERAAASLLAEEEAEKARQPAAGGGPGKKSKKKSAAKGKGAAPLPRKAAPAVAAARPSAGSDSDDGDAAMDESAMAAALARTKQGAAAKTPAAKTPLPPAPAPPPPPPAAQPAQKQKQQQQPASVAATAAVTPPLAALSLRPSPPPDAAHEDDTLCLICLDAERDTPLPGCETAHAPVLCAPCVVRLLTRPGAAATCPLCRAPAFPPDL